jgi:hypothetical protein
MTRQLLKSISVRSLIIHSIRAIVLVTTTSAFAALVLGAVWLLLGWMRFYGLETGVVAQALPLVHIDYQNSLLNFSAFVIDCYNSFFQGNSRFGSGLGLIAGACFSLLFLRKSPPQARMLGASLAGAIVAGRFCLTFTSSPAPFVVSLVLGSFCFFAIALVAREPLPALPLIGRHGKAHELS